MRLIEVTNFEGIKFFINPVHIIGIVSSQKDEPRDYNSKIFLLGDCHLSILETVEEIRKMLGDID